MVCVDISLRIDALVKAPQHHCKRWVLQRNCNLLASRLVVPVAEGIEVASHQVNLEVGIQDQQICKVDSAGSASCSGNSMVDVDYHDSVDILSTLPYWLTVGGVPQLDIEDCIPDPLMNTATGIDQWGNASTWGSSPHTDPMMVVVRGTTIRLLRLHTAVLFWANLIL